MSLIKSSASYFVRESLHFFMDYSEEHSKALHISSRKFLH